MSETWVSKSVQKKKNNFQVPCKEWGTLPFRAFLYSSIKVDI